MPPRRPKVDKSALAIGSPKRLRDESHRRYIASLPCCHCGAQPPTQAAHIRSGLAGGIGLKPSDDLTVPLCPPCHAAQHATSEEAFHRDIDAAKTLARSLYACSGDWVRGVRLIAEHRQSPGPSSLWETSSG